MNGRILKWIIYFWGAISLFVFVAIRFQPLFNGLLVEDVVENYWDKTIYGELYYFSMIRHFREKGLPPSKVKFEYTDKHASVNEADILAFGDSYFEFSRLKQFPERLADDFNKKVHTVNNDFPLSYLDQQNYIDTSPKIVLYERSERYIPVSFKDKHKIQVQSTGKVKTKRLLSKIKEMIFYESTEELYDVILKRSYATTWLYSFFTTLKFDLFGSISSFTPMYYKERGNSWLFYYDQVNEEITSFYYNHSDSDMDRICDNMAELALELKEKYNLYLVYLPIPAKYTLYHGLINNDPYNNFLPRLYEGLDQRDVRYINIYEDFSKSKDTLYFRTDSHWNQNGLDLAYEKTTEYFLFDSVLNEIFN